MQSRLVIKLEGGLFGNLNLMQTNPWMMDLGKSMKIEEKQLIDIKL